MPTITFIIFLVTSLNVEFVVNLSGINSEHLEPERSFYSTGHTDGIEEGLARDEAIRMVFQTAYDEDALFRMITDPALDSGERVLFVKEPRPGSYILVTEALTYSVDTYLFPDETTSDATRSQEVANFTPGTLVDFPRTRCERPLPFDTMSLLQVLWEEALMQTRHPEPIALEGTPVYVEGTRFHFSDRFGKHAGQTQSPQKDGKMKQLVSIGLSLEDYCQSGSEELLSDIEKKTKSLLRSLRHSRLR